MTSINTSSLDQTTLAFQKLPVEQQLAALGMLLKEISGSIPASVSSMSGEVVPLVQQIQEQRQDEQLQTLSDFLANETAKGDEVALDPHPSKALSELVPGSTQPAITRYKALDSNARLAFWYQLGQYLGDGIPAIPSDFSLSSEANELLTALRSLSLEQQAAFLSQVV
jgi:hypothetical protein